MAATRTGEFLRHLHPPDPGDGPLLARFAADRDPAAFAALVRRHGPMVLAVCRRVTGHPQDAEDAFQAAFLVLARSAGAVRKPDRLGSWLYGVAVKVAGRARRTALRRKRREATVAAFPDVPAPEPPPPFCAGPALHEELAALPVHHREPIVLCDLQGLSRAEAAKALGIAEGTLSSRLANGRKRLAERLTRRGVALAAAAVPGVLADGRAAVPESLVENTCGLAAAWAAGSPLPAAVVRLARGGFPMRGVLLGGFLTLSLAAGAALAVGLGDPPAPPPADPPRPQVVATAQPDAKPQPGPKKDGPPAKLGAPKLTRRADLDLKNAARAVWSPDGAWLAVQGSAPPRLGVPGNGDDTWIDLVPVADRTTKGQGWPVAPRSSLAGFSTDGRWLLILTREPGLISGASTVLRAEFRVEQVTVPGDPPQKVGVLRLAPVDPVEPPEIPVANPVELLAAPDGSAVYYLAYEIPRPLIRRVEVGRLDPKTFEARGKPVEIEGAFRRVHLAPEGRGVIAVADSGRVEAFGLPDGKQLWASEPPVTADEVGQPRVYPAVAVSRDGSRVLAIRGREGPVLLNGASGKRVVALEGAGPVEPMTTPRAAVSADGRLAALAYTPLRPRDPAGKGIGKGGFGTRNVPELETVRLVVWDTSTGNVLRSWQGRVSALAFHPTRPVLAILEPNGEQTRLGLWEFPAE